MVTTKGTKKQFRVITKTTQSYAPGFGTDSETIKTEYTRAVSSKQAINNIKRRNGIRPADLLCHGAYGYCRRVTFATEVCEEAIVV